MGPTKHQGVDPGAPAHVSRAAASRAAIGLGPFLAGDAERGRRHRLQPAAGDAAPAATANPVHAFLDPRQSLGDRAAAVGEATQHHLVVLGGRHGLRPLDEIAALEARGIGFDGPAPALAT